MRNVLALLIAAASAVATPGHAEISFVKTTCPFPSDIALRIVGAKGEMDGVGSEYEWLRTHLPDWKVVRQMSRNDGGKMFDVLEIAKGDLRQSICFDISDFFGKY